ncbi:MAG: YfhO family protein [Coriobacteriales bacterium]|nr:YfhO family protein [Coriobacteriales bacterium]
MKQTLSNLESRFSSYSPWRAYSLLFLPFFAITLFSVFLNGRSLVWQVDGMTQYYPFFVYEGQWIRSIVGSLFSGGGLQVPLWEWCLGYGVDIPTTFDVFLDPLNLVSAITPGFLSEWVFQLLIVLRLYLAGLAFMLYCTVRGENKTGTVLGALLYAFCGTALGIVQWTSGLHALILFPVILAGAELILAKKRPWLFIGSLTLLAIVSYYFTYMAIILLVGYLAVRVVMVEKPHLTPGRFLAQTARFAGLVVLCMLLAGFALVPAVTVLTGMERAVSAQADVPLLYDYSYYVSRLGDFLSVTYAGSDVFQGFGGMAFLGCVLLFTRKQENRALKRGLIVLAAFFLLPAVGSLFNGLNYATNRWSWAFALCVAFVMVRMVPTLRSLSKDDERLLIKATVCYALLLLIPTFRTEAHVAGMAALVGALFLLVAWRKPQTRRATIAIGLALTLGVNGLYFISPSEGGIGGTLTPIAGMYKALTSNSIDDLARNINDPSWWRYDSTQSVPRLRNNNLVLGLQSVDFYNSVYNDRIDEFHTELGLVGADINFSYNSLQSRAELMNLLGVRYTICDAIHTDPVPYGYDAANPLGEKNVNSKDYQIIGTGNALPLGMAFEQTISHEDYLKLTPIQRQQALLQAVVLKDAGASSVATDSLTYEDQSLPYAFVAASNATVEEGRIIAHAPNASVTLSFEGMAGADTYVYVSGLDFGGLRPSTLLSDDIKNEMPWYSRAKLMVGDLTYLEPSGYVVSMRTNLNTGAANITNSASYYHMYGGKDTWLANLGYSQEAPNQITLTFSQAGAYSFRDLQVVAQTHNQLQALLDARKATTLQDTQLGCNKLTGSIDLSSPQTLLLTVAYSKGWSALVDGKPQDILVGDTGFMALNLTAGHHDIELHYQTPGLVLGFAVTGVGVVLLVALVLWQRFACKKGKEQ